jgi:Tfp pilus assembly protein PilZ
MLAKIKPRRYERIGLRRGPLVAWQGPAGRTVSRANTLGMGGVFIQAAEPAPIGEGIRMVLKVAGGEVRARAMVRNSHPGKGMGVEFISMNPEDRARLRRLLAKLLGILRGPSSK